MKRKPHTPDQIVRKLREADRFLGEGVPFEEVPHQLSISTQTYHRWSSQCGAVCPQEIARLKTLEGENARLKKLLAEKTR